MRKLLLLGTMLTALAGSAHADVVLRVHGEWLIYPDRTSTGASAVSCEIVGATYRTHTDERWQELHDIAATGKVPPPRAWGLCVQAVPPFNHVPMKPDWPITNLGPYAGLTGLTCVGKAELPLHGHYDFLCYYGDDTLTPKGNNLSN